MAHGVTIRLGDTGRSGGTRSNTAASNVLPYRRSASGIRRGDVDGLILGYVYSNGPAPVGSLPSVQTLIDGAPDGQIWLKIAEDGIERPGSTEARDESAELPGT
jgi:hypothetical protein